MGISIDLISPYELTTAISIIKPNPSFFLDTFFKNTEAHSEDIIMYDEFTSGDGIAMFGLEQEDGFNIKKGVRRIKSFTIPTTNERLVFTAQELNEYKTLSEAINKGSRTQIQADYIQGKLTELKNRVYRRREMMAAKAISEGVITASQSNGNVNIDFGFVEHETTGHKYTLATKWDASNAKIREDLEKYSRIIAKRTGTTPKVAVLGTDAATALLSDTKIRTELNTNNFAVGRVDLNNGWDNSVRYLGRLSGLELYEYVGTYTNDAGTTTDILNSNLCVIVANEPTMYKIHKAAVNKIDGKKFDDIVINNYKDVKGNYIEWSAIQKSLPVPHKIDLIYSIKVLA